MQNISSTACFILNFQFSILNFPGPALIQASSALYGLAPSGRSLLLRLLLPDMALYCAEVYHNSGDATKPVIGEWGLGTGDWESLSPNP
jgi:hypothetical protein